MHRTKMIGAVTAAVAVMTLALPAAGAATAPPPQGTLTCALTGTGKFSPRYPSATTAPDGALKPFRFQMTADLTGCDASGVTDGKTAITTGRVRFTAKVSEGTTCEDLAFDAPDVTSYNNRLQVSLYGVNAGGGKTKVAGVKGLVSDYSKTGAAWDFAGDPIEYNNTGPFQDETVSLHLQIANAGDVGSCILGATDLQTVTFGAGSTITIAP